MELFMINHYLKNNQELYFGLSIGHIKALSIHLPTVLYNLPFMYPLVCPPICAFNFPPLSYLEHFL